MKCRISEIIDEIRTSNLVFGRKMPKKVITLFEERYILDISFNGQASLDIYETHLQKIIKRCKYKFDRKILAAKDIDKMIMYIESMKFEIKALRKNYLNANKDFIRTVKIENSFKLKEKYKDQVIEMINYFFDLKLYLANSLVDYFKHRLRMLERIRTKGIVIPVIVNKRKTRISKKLSLFPENNTSPSIKWARSQTDFMELLHALFSSDSFVSSGGPLNRKNLVDLFSWIFNFNIEDPNGVLRSAKMRKKANTPFLKELANVFENSAEELYA
ncbi:MAG: hypothetical protein DRI86_15890 [Bacteroidetes bacterium]|nr:MAG: hypothetical protein DRI86_15890 [Bacteroidota bacterium]